MSDYKVNPMDVGQVLKVLSDHNNTLQTKIEEMKSLRDQLTVIWEGEAKDTFDQTMVNDLNALDSYHSLMQNFCNTLNDINQDYVTTEQNNIQVIEADAPSGGGQS